MKIIACVLVFFGLVFNVSAGGKKEAAESGGKEAPEAKVLEAAFILHRTHDDGT